MGTPLLLQDLTTIRGNAGSQIVQSASSWLDLGNLEDVALYLDVRELSGATHIALEAANPRFETRIYRPDQVHVQGKLIGLWRRY